MLYIVVYKSGTVPHVASFYAECSHSAEETGRGLIPPGYSLLYIARVIVN